MEKLLDAYAAWPPNQQLIFAVIVLVIASVLSFVWGWWLMMFARDFVYYLTVWLRGWPDEPSSPTVSLVDAEPEKPWRHLLAWFSWRSASPTGAPDPALLSRGLQEPPRPTLPATTQQQRIAKPRRQRRENQPLDVPSAAQESSLGQVQ